MNCDKVGHQREKKSSKDIPSFLLLISFSFIIVLSFINILEIMSFSSELAYEHVLLISYSTFQVCGLTLLPNMECQYCIKLKYSDSYVTLIIIIEIDDLYS